MAGTGVKAKQGGSFYTKFRSSHESERKFIISRDKNAVNAIMHTSLLQNATYV